MADAKELLDHWDTLERIFRLDADPALRLKAAEEHADKVPHLMACNGVTAMRHCIVEMQNDLLYRLKNQVLPPAKKEAPVAKPKPKARAAKPKAPNTRRKPVVKRTQA